MRVAIVENMAGTHFGQVGVALDEAGAKTRVFRPHAGEALPDGPADFDALVVFGGEQSARADDSHPYLGALATLMRDFGAADRAVLGICLGSQILARGYGARNILGTAPEFGWQNVSVTEAGRDDPVLAAAGAEFRTFQWHSDTFTLPETACHLARSGAVAHQAFRIGRATYGTQFHFEASRDVVAQWSREAAAAAEAMHPGWAAAHPEMAAVLGPAADDAGLAIARAWVALI